MNYIDAKMPCHCEVRLVQNGPVQIKRLCVYHKINHPDLLISFHNWTVDKIDQLRDTLGKLKL